MIKVIDAKKSYGSREVLHGISLEIGRGEVVGLLGQNGAGKTTLMRMITGFLPINEGQILVDGTDISLDSMRARRQIGYLPETPPLYDQMTVTSYLTFAARLREIPASRIQSSVDECIQQTNLQDVRHSVIKTLSKGYRQRVGIAQAIVHQPDILILDEPTSGLDPVQILQVRRLIKELGQNHTVIVSTHVLNEIEDVAERIILIKSGRIVSDVPMTDIQGSGHSLEQYFLQQVGESADA